MGSSRHKARVAGAAMATGGMAVTVMAVGGAWPYWLGWVFRCGAKGFSHACRDGEVPWGTVLIALMAVGMGLLMLGGQVRSRRGGLSFHAQFTRHPDVRAPGDPPPAGEGPLLR